MPDKDSRSLIKRVKVYVGIYNDKAALDIFDKCRYGPPLLCMPYPIVHDQEDLHMLCMAMQSCIEPLCLQLAHVFLLIPCHSLSLQLKYYKFLVLEAYGHIRLPA